MRKVNIFVFFLFSILLCKAQESFENPYFNIIRSEFTGTLAFETVAYVEKYWRVAGNTGFNNTIFRIAEKLENAGYILEENAAASDRLTYRIEKRPLQNPTWEPEYASLTIIGESEPLLQQTTNRNMVYLNSVSTPKNGIIGEVVYLKTPKEIKNYNLKSKIVFGEFSGYRNFEEAIVNQGAIGLITYNNPSYLQPEKNITSIQFRSFPYQTKTKAWGIALSFIAKEKLVAALKKGNVKLNVNIQTKIYASEELTIVANVRGKNLPKERMVFSAHIQEPGANDNATGVGTQLEMAVLTAKLIKENKINVDRTLTYLWGDEIISTRRYIADDADRAKNIKWGISLDMVGENTAITGGSFLIEKMPDPSAIWTRGKDKHSEWGGTVMKLKDMKPHYFNDFILNNFKKQGEFANWEVNTNPFEGGSDHTPFLNANIPGLLLWHFTDQFYHTDNDRIDKVSQETMKNVGVGALVSALTLLNADSETADNVLNEIKKAAKERMDIEFQLSLEKIKKDGDYKEEKKIIKAWKNWYLATIESVIDLEQHRSKALKTQILQTRSSFKKSTKRQLLLLRKASPD